MHLLDCSNPLEPPKLVQSRIPGLEYFVAHSKGQLFILTNAHGAVDYQVMTASLHAPDLPHWQTLVPERPGVAVEDLEVYACHAVLYERHHGRPAVSVLSLQPHASEASAPQQPLASRLDFARVAPGVSDAVPAPAQMHQHQASSAVATLNEASPMIQSEPLQDQQQQQQDGLQQRPSLQQQAMLTGHQQPPHPLPLSVSFPPWALSIQPGANPDYHTRTVRLHAASPVHPQHVYDYHLDTGQLQLLGAEQVLGHDPERYVCHVQYATSPDGTQVADLSVPQGMVLLSVWHSQVHVWFDCTSQPPVKHSSTNHRLSFSAGASNIMLKVTSGCCSFHGMTLVNPVSYSHTMCDCEQRAATRFGMV